MRKTLVTLLTTMVTLSAVFCFMSACEKDADTGGDALDNYFANNPYVSDPRSGGESSVRISPQTATIESIGQEVLFTATGGDGGYSWGRSRPANGTITPRPGNSAQAVYRALAVAPNEVIVNDGDGEAAIAEITDNRGPLTITPASLTVDNVPTKTYNLLASGGVPPYDWLSTDVNYGTVAEGGANDEDCVYTVASTNTGANTVTLQDDDGNIKTITITHE